MSDLNKLNLLELNKKVLELKKRLSEARFDKATGKSIDTTAKSKLRKEIARVLTRINEMSVI